MKQIFTLAILLCFTACQQKIEQRPAVAAIDTAAIKASIDSVGGVVQKAHDLGDYKMLAGTWAKDGILSVAGSPPVEGRDAIVHAFASMPPPPPSSAMQTNIIDIEVIGPTWAYVYGVDTLKYTPPGSKIPVTETSTFFVLVKKTPEGWQTFREMLTPNQPQRTAPK